MRYTVDKDACVFIFQRQTELHASLFGLLCFSFSASFFRKACRRIDPNALDGVPLQPQRTIPHCLVTAVEIQQLAYDLGKVSVVGHALHVYLRC